MFLTRSAISKQKAEPKDSLRLPLELCSPAALGFLIHQMALDVDASLTIFLRSLFTPILSELLFVEL